MKKEMGSIHFTGSRWINIKWSWWISIYIWHWFSIKHNKSKLPHLFRWVQIWLFLCTSILTAGPSYEEIPLLFISAVLYDHLLCLRNDHLEKS